MADRWQWILADNLGNPFTGSHLATNRKLSFARNRAAEARVTLSLSDPPAVDLFALIRGRRLPTLTVLRNETVRYAGHYTSLAGGHATGEPSSVEVVFKDAFGLLDYRFTDDSSALVDVGLIVSDLITNTDTDWGALPLTEGTIEPTKDRIIAGYYGKVISEAIIELAETEGGFDFVPEYLNPSVTGGATMRWSIQASASTDRPAARFEFGTGTRENIQRYDLTMGLPVNVIRGLGTDAGAVPPAPSAFVSLQQDEDSTDNYGAYMQVITFGDIGDQPTLDDKTLDALRSDPVLVTAIKPDPAICPQPWDTWWLPDTVRVNIDDGGIQQQLEPKVQTVEITLDDDDNVSDLTIGIDPAGAGSYLAPSNSTRRYVQQQRDLLRRISALER